jgi:hypothetical protein
MLRTLAITAFVFLALILAPVVLALRGGGVLWATPGVLLVVIFLGCPATAVAVVVGLAYLMSARRRPRGKRLLLMIVAAWVGIGVGGFLSSAVRKQALERLVGRSRPLIAAIETYERKHRRAPESLNALVPEFLPAVPSPGPSVDWHYWADASEDGRTRWSLDTRIHYYNYHYQRLFYRSDRAYPKVEGRAVLQERIGDWALYFED